MLLSVNISSTPASESLLRFWSDRYTVDVSSLAKNPKFYGELVKASLPEARALTAAKLLKAVLERASHQAVAQARTLYEYIPDIIDSQLEQRITQFACKVYQTLLSFYQQQSGIVVTPVVKQMTSESHEESTLVLQTIPSVEKLLSELEHSLLKYQEQHFIAKEQRILGFMTTLFNFTNQLLINQLTPVEKVLLCPYFKFLEEQVALPWQRVCSAAARHQLNSPALALVQQMFPIASEISSAVYCQLLLSLPSNRQSLRGSLGNPEVTHSCLRDLDMFQAYLWLCVLEETLRPIEQELVPLCVMVMPNVGVEWDTIDKWKRHLVDEIESRVQPEHKSLLLNYTQGMEAAFFTARQRLGHPGDIIEYSSGFGDNLIIHVNSQKPF